jgi:DNA-directed RNA polymerase specialized sigma24 family protein
MNDSAETSYTADREARSALFDELDRLPDKYRSPVILCRASAN